MEDWKNIMTRVGQFVLFIIFFLTISIIVKNLPKYEALQNFE